MLPVNNSFSIFSYFFNLISISILFYCQIAVYRAARDQMRKIQQISVEAKDVFQGKGSSGHCNHYHWNIFRLLSSSGRISSDCRAVGNLTCQKIELLSVSRSFLLCNAVYNPLISCAKYGELTRKNLLRYVANKNP